MLTYALEKNGSSSLYTQLYGCIRRDILSGALPPRQKLPSKRLWPSIWRSASSR